MMSVIPWPLLALAIGIAAPATPGGRLVPAIHSMELTGSALPEGEQRAIVDNVLRKADETEMFGYYPPGNARGEVDQIRERIRHEYQDRGYFQVIIGSPVIHRTALDSRLVLDLQFPVTDGEQYRLGEISFEGQKLLTADQLRASIPLRSGDIFRVEAIRIGLNHIRELYAELGYVACGMVPDTRIDKEGRTISLAIEVDEGTQWHLGSLILDGVEPRAGLGRQLLKDWQQVKEPLYSPDHAQAFLRRHRALFPGNTWARTTVESYFDHDDQAVDVVLRFPSTAR